MQRNKAVHIILKIFKTKTASQPFNFVFKTLKVTLLSLRVYNFVFVKRDEKAPVQAGRYDLSKVGIKQWGLWLKAQNSHRLHMHEPWGAADE